MENIIGKYKVSLDGKEYEIEDIALAIHKSLQWEEILNIFRSIDDYESNLRFTEKVANAFNSRAEWYESLPEIDEQESKV